MDLVRILWAGAPAIGAKDAIYCGVKNGRHHIVGRDGDPLRKCTITGYVIEMGDAAGMDPHNPDTIVLLVKVRMNSRHPLIKREHLSHVDCLKSWYADAPEARN